MPGYVVVRIADTRTFIPGRFERFQELGVPSFDGGTVAFRADGASGAKGVYASTASGLSKVADLDTPVPGASGNFTFFPPPSIAGRVSVDSDGSVAFIASHSGGRGVYTNATGVLTPLVDDTFPVPGNPGGQYGNFFRISYDGGRIAFTAVSDGFLQGLYFADGTEVLRIADQSTPIPGGTGTFTDFGLSSFVGNPSLHGDEVVFTSKGDNRQSGVYVDRAGVLSVVADQTTLIPGTTTTFPPFGGSADVRDGAVAFDNGGIYRWSGGTIEKVADRQTRIPGGLFLRFTSFGAPSIDEGRVAFQGEASYLILQYLFIRLKTGIYTDLRDDLLAVVSRSLFQRIDGKLVKDLFSDAEALSDGMFAFKATFANGSEGVYVAMPQ